MKSLSLLITCLLLFSTLSAQLVGDKQTGLASSYSKEYHGATTAYEVTYDRNQLVAAHKAYPFNSTVRVRNEENGKSVVVRIIDKGPFIRGRIIEVSERAAIDLGMVGQRTVPVEITLLSTPSQPARIEDAPVIVRDPIVAVPIPAEREVEEPIRATRAADEAPAPVRTPAPEPSTPTNTAPPVVTPTAPAPAPTVVPVADRVVTAPAGKKNYVKSTTFAPGLYKVNLLQPPSGDFGVQVGSFSTLESAMDKIIELQGKYFDNILLHRIGGAPETAVYKVVLGPFTDRDSAKNYASDLKSRYKINGFTVVLANQP